MSIDASVTDPVPFAAPAPKPDFFAHNLTLGSEISLNFYLEIPDECADGTMTVSVSGRDGADNLEVEGTDYPYNEMTLKRYSVPLNVLQMAEDVTMTYTYNGKTVSETYSAEAYLQKMQGKEGNSPEVETLIDAIYAYGYWSQLYLDEYNTDFEVGEDKDYAPLAVCAAPAGVTADTLSAYAPVFGDMENVRLSLLLDSRTALRVYFGNTAPGTVTMNGNELTVEENGNGYLS